MTRLVASLPKCLSESSLQTQLASLTRPAAAAGLKGCRLDALPPPPRLSSPNMLQQLQKVVANDSQV